MELTISRKKAFAVVGAAAGVTALYFAVRSVIRRNTDNKIATHAQELAGGGSTTSTVQTKDSDGNAKRYTYPIEYGDRGDAVRMLQHGLNVVYGAGLAEDGIFGPKTQAAVKEYLGVDRVSASNAAGLYARYLAKTGTSGGTVATQSGTVGLPDSFI